MTIRSINLYARNPLGAYISGVLLRIYTAAGVYVTEGVTNGSGLLGPLSLDDGVSYHARASKTGCIFTLPYVLTFAADTDFDLTGTVPVQPTATNPAKCRISGYLRDAGGNAIRGLNIFMRPEKLRVVIDGEVITDKLVVKTDNNGYLDFELYRTLTYRVQPVGRWKEYFGWQLEDTEFVCELLDVPDYSSLGIAEFLMPRPARILFSQASVAVAAGGSDATTQITVRKTNLVDYDEGLLDYLEYDTADNAVATVTVDDSGILHVNGVAAGTTTVLVVRKDIPLIVLPDTALVVDTLTITVT